MSSTRSTELLASIDELLVTSNYELTTMALERLMPASECDASEQLMRSWESRPADALYCFVGTGSPPCSCSYTHPEQCRSSPNPQEPFSPPATIISRTEVDGVAGAIDVRWDYTYLMAWGSHSLTAGDRLAQLGYPFRPGDHPDSVVATDITFHLNQLATYLFTDWWQVGLIPLDGIVGVEGDSQDH